MVKFANGMDIKNVHRTIFHAHFLFICQSRFDNDYVNLCSKTYLQRR